MRTSELIKQLQKADPKDECTVCVSNSPVNGVDRQPWYYDGRLEYIERDKVTNKPIKIGYKGGSDKIVIHCDSIEGALYDYPEAQLELSGITYKNQVDERHLTYLKKCQKDGREFQKWREEYREARQNGTPEPPIVITASPESLQNKMHSWLKGLGLIK
jgi:hypothetical protein